ncbi:MAG: transposase [Gammaproteobacteria bacterium]|jgi:transposase
MNRAVSNDSTDREKVLVLEEKVQSLEHQLDWFKRQLFGRKSEKRLLKDNPHQPLLNGFADETHAAGPPPEKETITYTRAKQRSSDCVTDAGLRFDESVPKKTIRRSVPELEGPDAQDYDVIREERVYRLAQRQASYVVLEYVTPVVKHRTSQTLTTPKAPASVFPGSVADVSFVAGLLVEKLVYHQPLYRQHQRLTRDGITLARSTLTNLAHRGIVLIEPIYHAQLKHILQSKILAIDETPVKAGREKKGKMRLAWYWPVYGEDDEVAFTYSRSRGHQHLLTILDGFQGTILSDGHSAYTRYAKTVPGITHAQCWAHTRREFVKAETSQPEAVAQAFDLIGTLYHIERHIKTKGMDAEAALQCRATESKPGVDAFFAWCQDQCQRMDLVPSDPLSKALKYARKRETALRQHLAQPNLPMDTNHVERTLRVIPTGRKNWMFHWSEIGAERVGIIQSLLTTCRLHDINPSTYLIDVLQRIDTHPASRVDELTPRLWKTHFADNPLRSDVYHCND